MIGFTGPEIAALIDPGCIIASHASFNRQIQDQLSHNPLLAHLTSIQHWLRGVYLITQVKEDTGDIEYQLDDQEDINRLFTRLNRDDDHGNFYLELADGTKYELKAEGPLEGNALSNMLEKDLRSLLTSQVSLPCHLIFRPTEPLPENDCKDDKVAAVNLTRPFQPSGSLRLRVEKSFKKPRLNKST